MEDLPPEVVEAIQRNQKIEAIKLLRLERGIGLKEAKDAVDAYIAGHQTLDTSATVQRQKSMAGPVVILFVVVAVAYGLYRAFGL